MNFFGALINAAAEAAKAAAHAQAGAAPSRKPKGTACTPCAAHAYVDRVRAQYAPSAPSSRKRK